LRTCGGGDVADVGVAGAPLRDSHPGELADERLIFLRSEPANFRRCVEGPPRILPHSGGGYKFHRAQQTPTGGIYATSVYHPSHEATLGISLQSTTPASAAPERFCAKWLYGASLQREAWGGWSYKYERLRCLKWVYLDIPQPNRFVPFFGFGAIPTDPSPWVTLNPQPLPPKARRANVR